MAAPPHDVMLSQEDIMRPSQDSQIFYTTQNDSSPSPVFREIDPALDFSEFYDSKDMFASFED